MSDNNKVVLTIKGFDGYSHYNGNTIVLTKDQKRLLDWLMQEDFITEDVSFVNYEENETYDFTKE